jgi:branched-chain amino acid transport system permease protein
MRPTVPGRMSQRGRFALLEVTVFGVILLLPAVLGEFMVTLITQYLIFALLALSLDLVWGYGGILDLGRAAVFGWPAYVVALMATKLDISSGFILLPAAVAAGAVVGVLVGLFLFAGRGKRDEFFIAMSLLAFSFISQQVATSWAAIGSANGIPGIPLMTLGGPLLPGIGFYYLVAVILVVAYLLLRGLVRSQFGLILVASRQDDRRVSFLGYATWKVRLISYVISGALAGLAGALYAVHNGYVSPDMLGVTLSTQVLLWVLLGGRGVLIGAIVGALLLNYVSFQLNGSLSTAWQIVLGLIIVVGATALPRGVLSPFLPKQSRRFSRYERRAQPPVAPSVVSEGT